MADVDDGPDREPVPDRAAVLAWVAGYQAAWRSPDLGRLADLFASDVHYLVSPWADPIVGLEALARFWEAERDGPDEPFQLASEVLAIEGRSAVVRVTVDYGPPTAGRWRDLWVLVFDSLGLVARFEEWPFAPDQPDGHEPGSPYGLRSPGLRPSRAPRAGGR